MKKPLIVFFVLCQSLSLNAQNKNVPCPGIPTITYDGKTYNTVQIGSQCWLKENLNVGTMIDSTKDQTNNAIIEKYCYKDNLNNCATYGGLYQWAEAVQYQYGATNTTSPNPSFTGNIQGICPTGWHIPSIAEFQTLRTAVNNDGNALKAIGQKIIKYEGDSTNSSGFSALLEGYRDKDSYFGYLGSITYFWSSTETNTNGVYSLYLSNVNSNIFLYDIHSKRHGFNVRCLKD